MIKHFLEPFFQMNVLEELTAFIWIAVIALLFVIGIITTIRFGFFQFRHLGYALRSLWRSIRPSRGGQRGEISSFRALTMALAGTIGVGNIVGVATAIYLGGPGAVFWIWVMAIIGMSFKYAEGVLGVHFRERSESGAFVGGPMYYIKNGLSSRWHWLALMYAGFGVFAMLGTGNLVQSNAVAGILDDSFSISPVITGLVLTFLAAIVLIGGVRRIGYVAAQLVPIMALVYVIAGLLVLGANLHLFPEAFRLIFTSAFTGTAATGGFAGAMVIEAIRFGVARGVFANEAGLGTGAIAHAVAKTDSPVRQGAIAMSGTLIDTFLVCTMTALVIIISGAWMSGAQGPALSSLAFTHVLADYGRWIVTLCVAIFAFSTLLAYSYYGERCAEYLLGVKAIIPYRTIWVLAVFVGAISQLETVWLLADLFNAFMIIANITAILLLAPVVVRLTKEHFT